MTDVSASAMPFGPSSVAPDHGQQTKGKPMEKSYRKLSGQGICPQYAKRKWFARLLWKAFPESRSEEELSRIVSETLTKSGAPISPKMVKKWLRLENDAKLSQIIEVIALAGVESLFQIIDPEEGV